jgi:hypothetical protein
MLRPCTSAAIFSRWVLVEDWVLGYPYGAWADRYNKRWLSLCLVRPVL